MGRFRIALYGNDLLELRAKLADWGGKIDHRALPDNTPEQAQSLVTALHALALRMNALVDVNSYLVHGFFRENCIADIRAGDRAIVILMTYPERPLGGRVDSIGWGVYQDDGSAAPDLLPAISPTFEWIRLAQRIPVYVHLTQVPEEIKLRVGAAASVLVMTGTSGKEIKSSAVGARRQLQ